MPVVSKRRAAAENFGFTSPICELKEYSVLHAMAFAANARSQDVHVSHAEARVREARLQTKSSASPHLCASTFGVLLTGCNARGRAVHALDQQAQRASSPGMQSHSHKRCTVSLLSSFAGALARPCMRLYNDPTEALRRTIPS